MSYPGIPKAGESTQSIVETLDIFPTLSDLAGLPKPDFTQGVSLRPILENPKAPGHPAVSYGNGRTIRTDTHRLIVHKDGYSELYDHSSKAKETRNIASEKPKLVKELKKLLEQKLGK